jgi:hypothetical protein
VRRLDAAFDDGQESTVFFYEIAKLTQKRRQAAAVQKGGGLLQLVEHQFVNVAPAPFFTRLK